MRGTPPSGEKPCVEGGASCAGKSADVTTGARNVDLDGVAGVRIEGFGTAGERPRRHSP
jgi:hypothetical protein